MALDLFIKVGLTFLAIYCPLAFGAVHIFSFSLMETVVILLVGVWLLSQILKPQQEVVLATEGVGRKPALVVERTPLLYLWLLFIGLILWQILPLPQQVVKVISPQTWRLYQEAFGKVPAFITLSIYTYATRLELFKVLAYFGVFFLIIHWADSKEKIRGIVHIFVALGTFEAIYGMLEYLGGHNHIWWHKNIWGTLSATGTYINRNHLAGLLEITTPITFGLLIALAGRQERSSKKNRSRPAGIRGILLGLDLSNSERAKKILIIFLIAMMILGLILSRSRGGIISLTISFIFMNALLLFRQRFRRYSTAALIIGVIVLIYGLHLGMDITIERFGSIEKDAQVRMRLAKTSLNIWKDFPVFGTGWGSYLQAYRKYKSPEDDALEVDHAHHDWIELGAEMGTLGMGLVSLSFLFCLGYFLYLWHKKKNSFSVGIGLGGMGAMVSMALHSFTDFNMHIPANALLLSMAVGITLRALIYSHRQSNNRQSNIGSTQLERTKAKQNKVIIFSPNWLRWPLAFILVGGLCYAMVLVGRPYLAERILPTLPDSTRAEKKEPSLEDALAAIGHEQSNAEYFYSLAMILEKWSEKTDASEVIKEEKNGDRANLVKEVTLPRVNDLLLKVMGGDARQQKGLEEDLVLLALKKAVLLDPTNPYYHLKLAWHSFNSERWTEDTDQVEELLTSVEKGLDRAIYFMPVSANINFSVGCYWLWKSKVIDDEYAYLESFDRFVRHFQTAYQVNHEYKTSIQQMVKKYYPVDSILDRIFSSDPEQLLIMRDQG